MTDAQMVEIWRDRDVVDCLQQACREAVGDPETRRHPSIPHCEAARQFKVLVEDEDRELADTVLQRGIKLTTDGSSSAGELMVSSVLSQAKAAFGRDATLPPPPAPAPTIAEVHSSGADKGSVDAVVGLNEEQKAALAKHAKDEKAKEQTRLDKLQKIEDSRDKRAQEKADAKLQRQEAASTPEGRARTWLAGLQEHIRRADDEATLCKSTDCPLPIGLAREYASSWSTKSQAFRRTRAAIESVLNGKDVADFRRMVHRAEAMLTAFKSDMARYKALMKGYERQQTKDAAKVSAEKDAEDGDAP